MFYKSKRKRRIMQEKRYWSGQADGWHVLEIDEFPIGHIETRVSAHTEEIPNGRGNVESGALVLNTGPVFTFAVAAFIAAGWRAWFAGGFMAAWAAGSILPNRWPPTS